MKAPIFRLLSIVFLGFSAVAVAGTDLELEAGVIPVDLRWSEDFVLEGEIFELGDDLLARLVRLREGQSLLVRGFPVAPGERESVRFERFDVYSSDARIYVTDEQGRHEVGRSNRVHLLGTGSERSDMRIGLSLDPDASRLSGLVSQPAGVFHLSESRFSLFSIETSESDEKGVETSTFCDTPDPEEAIRLDELQPIWSPLLSRLPKSGHTHEATVAFETDGELIQDMFSGSPSAANTAIGDFMTAVNTIYERDFGLRLLQGQTELRSDPVTDPYTEPFLDGGGFINTAAQLSEFRTFWAANFSGVSRVFAAFLSGKGPSSGGGCSGAGRAAINSYCNNSASGSFSFTNVLRCRSLDGGSNVGLIGHEIGHNAGSPHTHCYPTPLDHCYNVASGCWNGALSCPDHTGIIPGIAAGKGTIMSYCNFGPPSGAGCGQSDPFFHPTVNSLVIQKIEEDTSPTCVQSSEGEIFSDGFESGNTTAWN